MIPSRHTTRRQSGFSMVEVLVALIILMVGLLGLAGLMIQSQRSEMESYQRVQALILLQDMYGRINVNRNVTSCYITPTYLGTPATGTTPVAAPACTAAGATSSPSTLLQKTQAQNDMTAWSLLLTGAGETSGGTSIGAMIGARGCLSYNNYLVSTELPEYSPTTGLATGAVIAGSGIYTLSVAWQGMGDTFAPPAGLPCAQGLYGAAETKRRVVSLSFRMAALDK